MSDNQSNIFSRINHFNKHLKENGQIFVRSRNSKKTLNVFDSASLFLRAFFFFGRRNTSYFSGVGSEQENFRLTSMMDYSFPCSQKVRDIPLPLPRSKKKRNGVKDPVRAKRIQNSVPVQSSMHCTAFFHGTNTSPQNKQKKKKLGINNYDNTLKCRFFFFTLVKIKLSVRLPTVSQTKKIVVLHPLKIINPYESTQYTPFFL